MKMVALGLFCRVVIGQKGEVARGDYRDC